MGYDRRVVIAGANVNIFSSSRDDGDFQIRNPAVDVAERRQAIIDTPWTWIRQVHGTTVLEVEEPGQHRGAEADGLITTATGCAIAVTTADCVPVVLVAERGVAVVHAGWRGLLGGIIESAGSRLRELAGDPVDAVIGPCVHPENYEFGTAELDQMAERYGPEVRSQTSSGSPALDMPAAVGEACRRAGWAVSEVGPCTSGVEFYSHRTRQDDQRLTTVAWIEVEDDG